MATREQATIAELDSLNNIKASRIRLGDSFGNNVSLTKCKTKGLRCAILGYTAKRTVKYLNISFRTVEVYIETLKLKFHRDIKIELIEPIIKNKLLRILES